MSLIFYGPWSLTVLSKVADFNERVRIAGADPSGDLIVDGVAGNSVPRIDANSWTLFMEWCPVGGTSWGDSAIKRMPFVDPINGITVTLGADDNLPELRDGDYNDLIVQLVYLNRTVNPPGTPPPYHFTFDKSQRYPQLPPLPGSDGSRCGCGGKPATNRKCGCR